MNVSLVTWCALGLAVTVAAFFFATAALYRILHRTHPSPFAASRIELHPRMIAPAPRLQANDTVELTTYRLFEDTKLNSYGWVDRDSGILRIPIERAMDLIAQRGLPTRGPGAQNSSGKTREQMVQERAATRP